MPTGLGRPEGRRARPARSGDFDPVRVIASVSHLGHHEGCALTVCDEACSLIFGRAQTRAAWPNAG
jgi:hypothetical protein